MKRKVAFRELEPTLRAAVARGAVAVPESEAHRLESARPDLPLLALLPRALRGLTLAHERGAVQRYCERRLEAILERDFPQRRGRASDRLDVRALAVALPAAASLPATPSWRRVRKIRSRRICREILHRGGQARRMGPAREPASAAKVRFTKCR